jgi:hypothetical protein
LPVTLWKLYEDIHEIFSHVEVEAGKVPARLVIGENPFGVDYGYLVLLRTDIWMVRFCVWRNDSDSQLFVANRVQVSIAVCCQ